MPDTLRASVGRPYEIGPSPCLSFAPFGYGHHEVVIRIGVRYPQHTTTDDFGRYVEPSPVIEVGEVSLVLTGIPFDEGENIEVPLGEPGRFVEFLKPQEVCC